jgi:hypothetical protein
MHSFIANHRAEIAEICRRYDVVKLEIFGSAARGEDFDRRRSDADFLVQFRRPSRLGPLEEYFGLQKALSTLLDRPVDLIEPTAVRNPYILADIDHSREVVYAA